ncbi:MAG TPA: phosphoribosylanthranilate isomerase [Chloroflexia bacterium]|nr:phosphoribosylanthranilate isomerase [Chloroflexia bacterium]
MREETAGACAVVKICGLREPAPVRAAAAAGAELIGFVFAPSKRQVAPAVAAVLIAALRQEWGAAAPRCVGLFVNEAPATIAGVVAACGLDLVQLCGDEPPGAATLVAIGVPVIRMLRPSSGDAAELAAQIAAWQAAAEAADALAGPVRGPWGRRLLIGLDAPQAGAYGGTGRLADWTLAADLAAQQPIMLAGGLTPANVAAARAAVRPWAVDVSSGVETAGRKDPALIQAFVAAAQNPTRDEF